MVTNRILFFDGSDNIGNSMQRIRLPSDWHLRVCALGECDFTSPEAIATTIRDFNPDLVINGASMADVLACETDNDKALDINFHAVAHIVAQCDLLSAPLVQLSTAYVFDGCGDAAYCPDDLRNPISAYGQTMAAGEDIVREGLYWGIILRTSLVFSGGGDNILPRMLRQIDGLDEIRASTKRIVSPICASACASALVSIADAILQGKGDGFGTFHLVGKPDVSAFDFLNAVMEAYAPFTSRRPKLIPTESEAVTVPTNAALNGDKLYQVYGIAPSAWSGDLKKEIESLAKDEG